MRIYIKGVFTPEELVHLVAYLQTLHGPAAPERDRERNPFTRSRPVGFGDNLDPTNNPAVVRAESAEAAWGRRGPAGKTCADCHAGGAATAMRGVATRYPRHLPAYGRVMAIEDFLAVHGPETTGEALPIESAGNVDLTMLVKMASDGLPVAAVLNAWTRTLIDQLEAVHLADLQRGPTTYRVFLFPDALQVDLSMTPAAQFRPAGPRFRLLFGATAAGESEGSTPPVAGGLFLSTPPVAGDLFGWGVIYALHARACIERGRVWQAEHYVGAVRDHALSLACLRQGLPAVQARGYDDLSADTLARFEDAPRRRHRSARPRSRRDLLDLDIDTGLAEQLAGEVLGRSGHRVAQIEEGSARERRGELDVAVDQHAETDEEQHDRSVTAAVSLRRRHAHHFFSGFGAAAPAAGRVGCRCLPLSIRERLGRRVVEHRT